jgi:arabinogalactan endo-1,4-beta-galactosidase
MSIVARVTAVLLAGTLLTASGNQITYQINMGVQRTLGNFNPAGGDTVVVSGTFSTTDWTTTSLLSPAGGATNIYVGTFSNDVASGSFENHKFIINPHGNSSGAQLVWESGNNRFFQVAGTNQTLPVVYFNNVTNASSTVVTQITFRVNLETQAALSLFDPATDTVLVASDAINNWDLATAPLTNSLLQPNLWRATFAVTNSTGATVNYKFIIHRQGGEAVWERDGVGPGGAQNRQFAFTGSALMLPIADFNNAPPARPFIAGADMSHLAFFEDRGITYRANGQLQDAFFMLRERGLNCVRLRLFTSSAAQAQADPYNYTNNLDYTLPLAVRAKNAGFKFLLDFHYSDSWADPGKQTTPSGWTNLTFTQLTAQMRSYSSNVIASLIAAGAAPEYVQLGNEITPGILWNDGRVGGSYDTSNQWSQLAQLLTSSAQGIKDAASNRMPKLIVHIDRGGDWPSTQWYFDNLEAQQVPFDYIGESYYPWWHGSPDALRDCLTNAAARYGRPLIVAETAFPWANSTNLYGFTATTNGQVDYVVALAQIVKGVPDGKGIGIFWWGTEYQQLFGYTLGGFDKRSFFGLGGDVLPAADAFGQMTAPLKLTFGLEGNNLRLQWPLSGAGMNLRTTTDLSVPVWLAVTNSVHTTGAVFNTIVPLGPAPSSYFRLQSN